MDFNNQNTHDEVHTKLLLMLPMVPKKEIEHVNLNFLRLVQAGHSTSSESLVAAAVGRNVNVDSNDVGGTGDLEQVEEEEKLDDRAKTGHFAAVDLKDSSQYQGNLVRSTHIVKPLHLETDKN